MIYKCHPQMVSRIWGSLPAVKSGEEPVGEIWWFTDNTVLEGEGGIRRRADEFFPRNSFPLIIKTLHAARDLSIQVHPGKDGTTPVKDESWVVLSGSGKIMHGVVAGITPIQFRDSVKNGSVQNILQCIHGEPGVFVHLPAGTIHALGAGLTVLEVQLNCTVTYRLWDYCRKDIRGNFRELHVEEGLRAVNWKKMGRATLISEDSFNAGSYHMRKSGAGHITLEPREILFLPEEQQCFFAGATGGTLLTRGDSWIVGIER